MNPEDEKVWEHDLLYAARQARAHYAFLVEHDEPNQPRTTAYRRRQEEYRRAEQTVLDLIQGET